MPSFRHSNLVEGLFVVEKLGNRQRRILPKRQEEARDIQTCEIHAVVNTMLIWIASKKCVVPRFELTAEHQVNSKWRCTFSI
jgi:hypothetical protein